MLFNNHSPCYNKCDWDIGCLHIAAPQWMCSASWTSSIHGSSRMWDNPLKLRHSVKRVNDKQWGCSKMKFVGLCASTFLDAVRDSHSVKGSLLPLLVNSAGAMTLEFNFRGKKMKPKERKGVFFIRMLRISTLTKKMFFGEIWNYLTSWQEAWGWIKKKKDVLLNWIGVEMTCLSCRTSRPKHSNRFDILTCFRRKLGKIKTFHQLTDKLRLFFSHSTMRSEQLCEPSRLFRAEICMAGPSQEIGRHSSA